MLHHVTLETTAADAERFGELLVAIGFEPLSPPASLAEDFHWFAGAGTQVHLALVDSPIVPSVGHAAFVVDPLPPAVEQLRELGYEVSDGRQHWGSARVTVAAPGGHRIELMAAPPQ